MKKVRKSLKAEKIKKDKNSNKKQNHKKQKIGNISRQEKIRRIISSSIQYTKLKYNSKIYSIGDNVIVRDTSGLYLVANIKKIIKSNGIKKYSFWPTMEVEW